MIRFDLKSSHFRRRESAAFDEWKANENRINAFYADAFLIVISLSQAGSSQGERQQVLVGGQLPA